MTSRRVSRGSLRPNGNFSVISRAWTFRACPASMRSGSTQSFSNTGIARVDPRTTNNPQAAGLPGRLSTYRNSRLTSDFAIAVAFRFVVPSLSAEDRSRLASGDLGVRAVQALTKEWIATNVTFSADAVAPAVAVRAESAVRRSGVDGSGAPAFNPVG